MENFRHSLCLNLLGLAIILFLPSMGLAGTHHEHASHSNHSHEMQVEATSPFSKSSVELKFYCPMHKHLLAEPCPHHSHVKLHKPEKKRNGEQPVCFLSKQCKRSGVPIASSSSGYDFSFVISMGIQSPHYFPTNNITLFLDTVKSVFIDSISPPPKVVS